MDELVYSELIKQNMQKLLEARTYFHSKDINLNVILFGPSDDISEFIYFASLIKSTYYCFPLWQVWLFFKVLFGQNCLNF